MMTGAEKLDKRYPLAKRMVEEGSASAKVERAVELLLEERTGLEIAEIMGLSKTRAYALLNDPDDSKAKARKSLVHGHCEDCGAKTFNAGSHDTPKRCRKCAETRLADRNEEIFEMWEADEPTWYIAEKFGMAEHAVTGLVDTYRRKGRDLPLRRLPSSAKRNWVKAIELRKEGLSNQEVADRLGYASAGSVAFVFVQARRHGFDFPRRHAHGLAA